MPQSILQKKFGRHNPHNPLRRCLVSKTRQPLHKMIRFIIDKDGTAVPDVAKTLPGRGIWITCNRSLLEKAITHSLFTRVSRRSIRIDHSIISMIIAELEQRCLTLLGQIRRAGRLIIGFQDVYNTLQYHKAELNDTSPVLIHASDAPEQRCLQLHKVASELSVIDTFCATRLGSALGCKKGIEHALASHPSLTKVLLNEIQRLDTLSSGQISTKQCVYPSILD